MIYPPIDETLTTSTWTAIRLPAGFGCQEFSLWTEDSTEWYISSESDGSDEITVPANLPISLSKAHPKNTSGAILCYAKGTTTSKLVGLITR